MIGTPATSRTVSNKANYISHTLLCRRWKLYRLNPGPFISRHIACNLKNLSQPAVKAFRASHAIAICRPLPHVGEIVGSPKESYRADEKQARGNPAPQFILASAGDCMGRLSDAWSPSA
ncbi:MAG: hypothetical protein Q9194_004389 [Teloschistes cf. exilis]